MGVLGVLVVGFLLAVFAFVKAFLYIGRPNEVLIFSGRDYRLPSGEKIGYRVLLGGRTMLWPFLEKIDRIDLTIMPVHINIHGAYSRGGIPLNVQAVANVKIDSNQRNIHNAIERFLGRSRNEVLRVAQETLEGNLRGVLATLTPEEVNENRLLFAERLANAAEPDFEKLGLHLDTLKIQNVSDDRDYLESLGRKRIAEVIKVAEVAESNSMKTAEEVEAGAQGEGEVARRNAQAQIQVSQNALRELQAQLELDARSEEERASARALAARAEAEQELQQVRTELEKIRLQADIVIPAEADKVARELVAAGEAAEIAERGRAMAEVLRMMSEVWQEAGESAMDVFILQRIESVMLKVSAAARQVKVREVALIDSGSGETLPNYVSAFPKIVSTIFAEMRDTVGIDIGGVLTGNHMRGNNGGGDSQQGSGGVKRPLDALKRGQERSNLFEGRPGTQHSIPKLGGQGPVGADET
ncbi:MAG: flotillin family protein [Bradymonadaceae bacterium]|nr:flotillin family protein [Lujinxingiaceae bacterium]